MIDTESLLIDSLEQALEKMAFLTIVSPEEDIAAPEETILAEISFTGPQKGTIQILAGLDLCKILAKNIAALTDANGEACYDALKELSNVTCGLIVPKLAFSQADIFDLTIPTIKNEGNCPSWNEFIEQPDTCILDIEGYLVAARLTLIN
jgi:CheY-specific phosphatase CheX